MHLIVWGWYNGQLDDINSKIFGGYEKAHPGVTVEYRAFPADNYETNLTTGLAGSQGPDVVQLQAYGILQKHIEAGSLVALDNNNVPGLSTFDNFLLDGARGVKDSKVYGVPFAIQTAHVFYNKKIFAELGLSVPTTWEEFLSICDTLKGSKYFPLAWNFKDTWETPLYHEIFGASAYGGADFQTKFLSGQVKLTDPAYIASLDRLVQLKPYLPSGFTALGYSDATTTFASGKAAMLPDGIWNVVGIKKVAPSIDLGIFPVPPNSGSSFKATTTTYVDGSFGASVKSTHPKESLDLLSWMTTKEFGQLYSDVLGQLSAVPGVTPQDPILNEAQQAATDSPNPYLCYSKLNGGTPSCDELVTQNVQQLMLGKLAPSQAAANIQKGLDQWFKPQQ